MDIDLARAQPKLLVRLAFDILQSVGRRSVVEEDRDRPACGPIGEGVVSDDFRHLGRRPDDHADRLPGVSPELRARVNGQDFYIRVGGFLREVLDLKNRDDGPPRTLKVRRPYHGRLVPIKFNPNSRDILMLVLLPGDEITW